MSPDRQASGSVRSAAIVNQEIRHLWQHAGGHLTTDTERAEYARLVVEWATAVRAEQQIAEAA